MLVVMSVTIFSSRIILQGLGASDYGIYNVIGGVVSMMVFLNSALSASTSRFLMYDLGIGNVEQLKKTFSASLNLHISVAIIVFVICETAGVWFLYNKMEIPDDRMTAAFWVLQFSIVSMAINYTQVPYNAALVSHENMSIYAFVGLYEAFSKLGIAYLIFIAPIDKLIFYGILLLLNTVAIQLFYRFYTKRKYEECRFRLIKDKALYKKLLSYSVWDLFGGVAGVSQGQGVNVLLNVFFGPLVNAARGISFQIQSAVKMFINNFLTAVRPQVVKSFAEKNYSRMYGLTFKAIKFSLLIMMALVLPIIFETDFVLNLWLGNTYPKETSLFAKIILVSALFDVIEVGQNMAFHAIGRIRVGNVVCGTIMILSLPISYLLLKLGFPSYVPFIIVIITNLINEVLTLLIMKSYVFFSIKDLLIKTYIPVIGAFTITILMPYLICKNYEASILRFVVNVMAIELILVLTSWFIVTTREEKIFIKSFVNKHIKKNANN